MKNYSKNIKSLAELLENPELLLSDLVVTCNVVEYDLYSHNLKYFKNITIEII